MRQVWAAIAALFLLTAPALAQYQVNGNGPTGIAVPPSAVYLGVNVGGNLTGVSALTPKILNALSTTVTAIKSSAAGQLGAVYCWNPNSSVAYIQIFDVATAGAVTLGTTAPKLSLGIPPTNSGGFTLSAIGVSFTTGIQVAATTTATGSTAPATALDCNAAFN